MSRYAERTEVGVERSQAEILGLLKRFGIRRYTVLQDEVGTGAIRFEMEGRWYEVSVPVPDPDADEFRYTATGRERDAYTAEEMWEREVMRRWRALALLVKAKLVAQEEGVASGKDEWLAYLLLPDGSTMGQAIEPQIEQMYQSGKIPRPLAGYLPASEVRGA